MKLRITVEGKTYDVEVEILDSGERLAAAGDDEQPLAIPESVLHARPPRDDMPDDKICRSPIAGVITAVCVALGQAVKRDETLLTIEAMKMQTNIGSPAEGVIKAINTAPGYSVRAGQVLVELA